MLLLSVLLLTTSIVAGESKQPLRVGEVRIVVIDVYGAEELEESSGIIGAIHRTMNTLHPGTRHHVVRRELLVKEGDAYDPALVHETERNLRSLGFLTNVSVAAVDTLDDGSVPVEVRVQETWSLSTRVSYSKSSSSDRWTAMLSDGNFMGYGVKLEAGLGQDEDRDWQHLGFENRRLFGSSLMLSVAAIDLSDGSTHRARLSRPFYAQDDPSSWNLFAWDNVFSPRYYLNLEPSADESLARLYVSPKVKHEGVDATWSRRLSKAGEGRLWRLGLGVTSEHVTYDLDETLKASDDTYLTSDEFRDAAGRALSRETGRTVRAFLHLETLGRGWTTDRYVMRYGVDEDIMLDPYLSLRMGPALDALGSDGERLVVEMTSRDWSRWAGGWLHTRFEGAGAFGDESQRWHLLDLKVGWLRKALGGMNRLWVEGVTGRDISGTQVPVLGLTRGLRTLEYDGMAGDRLLRWNAEHAHLVSGEILGFYRMAIAGFYAGGSAWWNDAPDSRRVVRQELGIGLRFGSTRSSRAEVSRLDLAWPLDGSSGPKLTAATGAFF